MTSRSKIEKKIEKAHFASLMYEFIIISKESDDLSISFFPSLRTRQGELTKIRRSKRKQLSRTYMKEIFELSEHQENEPFQQLTFQRMC